MYGTSGNKDPDSINRTDPRMKMAKLKRKGENYKNIFSNESGRDYLFIFCLKIKTFDAVEKRPNTIK
jgi:hypothetical protein